jgi:HlyD family secretion protein
MVANQDSARNSRSARSRKLLVRVAGYAGLAALVGLVWYLMVAIPIRVLHHTVQRGPIVSETMGTGTLEARVKATISPKISARVERVLVDQGDYVKASQTLVRLDNDELLQQVEIANASVAAAKAGLDRLTADKDRALAVLVQARFDFQRMSKLYEHDTAASVELEKAAEAKSIAQAELARAEAAIVEGQKEIIADQRTLAYHQARLADTVIAAPFDGLIVRRYRDPGDVVVPGSPVLTLISTEELWISAWVDETEMAAIRPGQQVRVIFRSQPERAYAGTVSRLGREADRETREFVVDVRVLELPENWAIGQRAEVFIETARREGVSVLPATYVLLRDGVVGVYVEQNERAIWRPIKIGLRSRNSVEVVDGLQPSDTVLIPTDPKSALGDGRRVEHSR